MLRAYRNAVIADAEALRFSTALTAVICNSAALVFNAAFKFCPHGNKIICFTQFALQETLRYLRGIFNGSALFRVCSDGEAADCANRESLCVRK